MDWVCGLDEVGGVIREEIGVCCGGFHVKRSEEEVHVVNFGRELEVMQMCMDKLCCFNGSYSQVRRFSLVRIFSPVTMMGVDSLSV